MQGEGRDYTDAQTLGQRSGQRSGQTSGQRSGQTLGQRLGQTLGQRLGQRLGQIREVQRAAALVFAFVKPVEAQQIQGTPGSPDATTTIDGRQTPPPPQESRGKIEREAIKSQPDWPGRIVPPKGAPNVPPSSPTIPDMGSPVHLVASYRRQPWIGSLAMAWARPISTRPRCGSPTRAVDQRPQIIIRLDLASFASKQLGEQEVAAGRLLDTHEPRTAQTCGAMSSHSLRSRSLDSHSRSLRH